MAATTSNNNLALVVNSGTVDLGMNGMNIDIDRGLTINGGLVAFTGNTSSGISSVQPVTMTGTSTLNLGGLNLSIGALATTAGTIIENNTASTTSTFSFGNNPATTTFANGTVAGNLVNGTGVLSISKNGSGTETLSGVNTYTGATNIGNGILNIASSAAIPSGSTIAFNYGGINLNSGGLVNATGSPLTYANALAFPGSAVFNGTGNLTFTAPSFTVATTGTKNISLGGTGNVTFTGALSNSIDSSWSIFAQGNQYPFFVAPGSLTMGAVAVSVSSNDTFTIGGWANVTYSGLISDGGTASASIVVDSNIGTTTLQGVNTFHGAFNLGPATASEPSGTVLISNSQALGLGSILWNSFALQSSTPLTGTNAISNNINFQGGVQGNLANGGNGQVGGTNAIQLSGSFTNFGGNRSLLVTDTGGTTLSGNVYLSEVTGTARTLTILADAPITISGAIASSNGGTQASALTVAGTNTLTLSGGNTYAGVTTLSGGTLGLDYSTNNNSKISTTAALIANGGATLNLNGGSFTQMVSGTTLSSGGDLNITQSAGTSTLQLNAITRSNGSGLNVGTAGIASTNTSNAAVGGIIGGWATVGGADWAVSATSASNTPITALPAGSYQTGVDSTWAATDNVSISGSTTLTGSRTFNTLKLALTAAGQSMNLGSGLTQTINAGGILYAGPSNYSITNGTIKAGQASSPELILNQWGTGSLTIGSVIANGTGGVSQLTKLGSGTVMLNANNTYTGTTFVDNGTLALGVNNAINSSTAQDIQVSGGGTFDLAGHTQTIRNVNIANNIINGGTVTSSAPGGVLTENENITNGANSNVLYTGQLALVLSEPGTGTSAITMQLSNPNNNFSGGLTVSGSGTFTTSQLSNAGTGGTNLASWVGTSDLRLNANTAVGTGTITLNDARIWTQSNTFYTISNNIAVTANGGWLATDSSSSAYLGAISTVSGSPLLAIGGDTNSRPTSNLWGSMSGFTGTLAVDTVNSNVSLYGSSLGSANANLMFYNNGSAAGILQWAGSIATPVTISFAEISNLVGSSGGHLQTSQAANVTFQIGDNTSNTTTFSGAFQNGSGLVSVTKVGTNTQILSGVNSYTGPTTVNGGTLSISGSLASGTASTVNGGSLLAIGSGTIPGAITVNGGSAGVATGGTISGGVTVNGGGALVALGTATVGSTAGTLSGPVTIAGGSTLATRGAINLVDNTIKTVNLTGGLTLGGTTAGNSSSMAFDFGSGGNNSDLINLTVTPLTVNVGGAIISLSNLGSNPGGGQIYTLMNYPSANGAGFAIGTGTTVGDLSLSTTNFGPLTAQLIVTATALEVQVNGTVVTPTAAYWTGAVDNKWTSFIGTTANFATTAAGTTSVSGFVGATTDVYFGANSAANIDTTMGQNFSVQTLNFTGAGTSGTGAYVINGNTSGANLLTIAGNGAGTGVTLAAGSGGATVNVTTLVLGQTQTWTNNSSNPLTVNSNISQSGTAGLTLASGKFVLGGSNSYSGGTSINNAVVQLTGSGTLGASTNPLTMTGGSLDMHGLPVSVGQLNGTSSSVIENNGPGTVTLSIASDNSSGGNFQGNIVDNTSGTGKIALAMAGAGSAALSGTNNFSGGVTLSGGGTLTAGSASALGAASNTLSLTNNSTLQMNGFNASVSTLSGTSGTTISNSASTPVTLTVNSNSSSAFLGSLSDGGSPGTLSLVKNGTGTIALSSNGNSYNGNTYINNGTLGMNAGSDLGNGTITLGDGSSSNNASLILGGTGFTMANPITVAAGGTGTYSIVSNTNVDFTLNGPIALNNNLTLSCNQPHAIFIDGVITGAANITIDGGGISTAGNPNNFFSIQGANSATFTGNIKIVNSGEVKFTNNGTAPLGVATTLFLDNTARIDTGGATFTVAGLSDLVAGGGAGASLIDYQGALGVGGSGTYTYSGTISNSGSIVKTGTGAQILAGSNSYAGGTNVAGGTLIFAAPFALPNFSNLTVGAGGIAVAAFHGVNPKNTLFTSSLSITGTTAAWTGTVDLNDNDMLVQNGALSDITDQVKQGYNSGNWNGSGGIISTAAGSDPKHLHALGVIQNSIDGTTTGATLYGNGGPYSAFDGASASASTDVLVKYTYYGDANLDGRIDGSDYSRIDSGVAMGLSGWFNGDFNYDGVINGSDYTLIDNSFNTQGAQISAQTASPTAQLAGGATSAVPEPATLGFLGLGVVGLLGRRRRGVC